MRRRSYLLDLLKTNALPLVDSSTCERLRALHVASERAETRLKQITDAEETMSWDRKGQVIVDSWRAKTELREHIEGLRKLISLVTAAGAASSCSELVPPRRRRGDSNIPEGIPK